MIKPSHKRLYLETTTIDGESELKRELGGLNFFFKKKLNVFIEYKRQLALRALCKNGKKKQFIFK